MTVGRRVSDPLIRLDRGLLRAHKLSTFFHERETVIIYIDEVLFVDMIVNLFRGVTRFFQDRICDMRSMKNKKN